MKRSASPESFASSLPSLPSLPLSPPPELPPGRPSRKSKIPVQPAPERPAVATLTTCEPRDQRRDVEMPASSRNPINYAVGVDVSRATIGVASLSPNVQQQPVRRSLHHFVGPSPPPARCFCFAAPSSH
ncbi:hypothetical protein Aduo_001741 [Ancylostoma duodenale]